MLKTAGTIFAVLAIGTVVIAWSHREAPQPPQRAETIIPEKVLSGGPLPEQRFTDMSFVYAGDN